LLVPALAERRRRWTFWAGSTLALGAIGTTGSILWPTAPVLGGWGWAALMAIGVGAGFPLGLAVIAWRTPDGGASAATSGLALGFGYVATGFAPLLMGLLLDLTGHYEVALAVLLVAAVLQALAIRRIGNGTRVVTADPAGADPADSTARDPAR
jgi:MFS transporter, CP family, cyanate transporter